MEPIITGDAVKLIPERLVSSVQCSEARVKSPRYRDEIGIHSQIDPRNRAVKVRVLTYLYINFSIFVISP